MCTIIGSTKGAALKVLKIGLNHFLLKELSILMRLQKRQRQQQSTDGADHVIKLEGMEKKRWILAEP